MRRTLLLLIGLTLVIAAAPPAVSAHGGEDDEEAETQTAPGEAQAPPASPAEQEEREIAALAEEPARVLAQQAIALLEVREDEHEAEARVEAALMSEDQEGVDVAALEQAEVALTAGELDAAVEALDRALSQPLGAESGKSLHKAEQGADRSDETQQLIAIILGAALLLLAAALLLPRRTSES